MSDDERRENNAKSPESERVFIVLTKIYTDALEQLVEKGIYMDRQTAIREALRRLFKNYGIKTFHQNAKEKIDKSDIRRIREQVEEYVKQTDGYISLSEEYVTRTEELMGEILRRLKILDGVAVILEVYPDSADDKQALEEIRATMKNTLEARAYARSLPSKEDEGVK